MLNTININLKTDIKTDRPTTLPITLMSQDKNNNQFIMRFTNGGESVTLDDTYTVEVLTKFSKSGTSRLTTAKVRQDYATWEFDTAYITQDETVYNYVYVRKSGNLVVSADANCFVFSVGLSEIDKDAGRVAEAYDENYEKVLLDYSGALDERTTERLDEAVDDFNQRGDVEIDDWREHADVELEDYLADRVVLKNDVENGDFSQGTTGWSVSGASIVVEDGGLILSASGTSSYPNINTTSSTLKVGDLCYIKGSLMVLDEGVASIRFVTSGTNGIHIPNPVPNVWYEESKVVTSTGSTVLGQVTYATAEAPIGKKSKFGDILVINLTQTFGAGNEPTKDEMDELIKITGYFDEITLTQKQLLNWQLKLMRQNRNALIALGGTII